MTTFVGYATEWLYKIWLAINWPWPKSAPCIGVLKNETKSKSHIISSTFIVNENG